MQAASKRERIAASEVLLVEPPIEALGKNVLHLSQEDDNTDLEHSTKRRRSEQ